MKKIQIYYLAFAVLLLCGLFFLGLFSKSRESIGLMQILLISWAPVIGVLLWLGWFLVRIICAVNDVTERFKDVDPELSRHNNVLDPLKTTVVDRLNEVIDTRLAVDADNINKLENMVKELQLQIQLSQRQQQNTEAIIYSIKDAVVVVESNKLIMANDACEKLFGFVFSRSRNRSISEVFTGSHSGFAELLRQTASNKIGATRRELQFLVDNRTRTFDSIFSRVSDKDDKISGVVVVLHDITHEKEISKMKDDFVSYVSHELKTPLASITAYTEMLIDGEIESESSRKEFYSIIQNQAARLNRFIEDILNISRIESGMMKVEKKPISMTIVIEEQLQMIKGYAEEKEIKLIHQNPIVHDQIHADRDMMAQVVINLLSNAVKYTSKGGTIKIQIDVDEISKHLRVAITDTGVGIGEDELNHVFDKFYRASTSGGAKGTGLGLSLVKQIVEKIHDGRVFAESKLGEGSTFGFELPLMKSSPVPV